LVNVNSTKTSLNHTLNPRRIHEICVDYVDEHLSTKYLHRSHVDEIHVESIEDAVFRFIEKVETFNTRRHTI